MQDDNHVLCPDSPYLVQRYVLALFYFATDGDNWPLCSADETSTPCVDENGTEIVRFLSNTNECEWYGVVCDFDKFVTLIEIGKIHIVRIRFPPYVYFTS